MNALRQVVAPVVLALAASLGVAGASADPIASLPARALLIETGIVSFQAALVVDMSNPSPLVKLPTKYMLYVTNETSSPVWLKLDWRVPGQKPFSSFGKVDAGEWVSGWVIARKEVAWDQEIAVDVALFGDKKRNRRLGGREVAFSFDGKDAAQFLAQAKEVNRAFVKMAYAHGKPVDQPILAGFREMDLVTPVPGTSADAEEQQTVKRFLWRRQSIEHWDCRHRVLDAQPLDPRQVDLEDLDADARARLEADIERGGLHLEEWRVESCDQVDSYRVTLHRRPGLPTFVAVSESIEPAGPGGESHEPERGAKLRLHAAIATDTLADSTKLAAESEDDLSEQLRLAGPLELVVEEGLKEQITLSIPGGWSAHNPTKLITGTPGPLGTVLYSPAKLVATGEETRDTLFESMTKLSSGEIPSLQLDRIAAPKGTTCAGITPAAERRILRIVKDQEPMFARGHTVVEAARAEPAALTGVRGLRIRARSRNPEGVERALDLIA